MAYVDRMFKAVVNRCDLCNDPVPSKEDLEAKVDMLTEIDDSYESEYDKSEPKLLLCSYCKNEYLLPNY
jgi:uncharacterized protein (UPF0305 family)